MAEVLRKFISFLEHGKPNRRGPAATKMAARDVKAAALKDVAGLTNRQIGEELRIPLPVDFVIKGDHPAVRKMIGRGRKILEAALGEKGWHTQAETMKAEASRWQSIDTNRQYAEIESEMLGVLHEEDSPREQEYRTNRFHM